MNHLDALRRKLDLYSAQYEHLILLGDINIESKEQCMLSFLELYEFKNLKIKSNTAGTELVFALPETA